ncbi:MAG: GtrA family protein [Patescibacteria group bacterium]|jgi:putative flippase GtrA
MHLRKEVKKLTRFIFVGSTTFLLQTLVYYFLTRWLLADLPRLASYSIALAYSLAYNYSLNRSWTFKDQSSARGSVRRYAIVASLATVFSLTLFWVGEDLLRIYDLIVVVGVNVLIPFFTFVSHRLYTFNNKSITKHQ